MEKEIKAVSVQDLVNLHRAIVTGSIDDRVAEDSVKYGYKTEKQVVRGNEKRARLAFEAQGREFLKANKLENMQGMRDTEKGDEVYFCLEGLEK